MRHRKTRRPSAAQLAAIGKVHGECKRLGVAAVRRPDGIAKATWSKCYEMGYIVTADHNGGLPLVRVGSHGIGWIHAATMKPPAPAEG